MLAASLAADVPLFMASPTSAWASAGASLVPSPVIATRWPSPCSSRMKPILSSGLAWAMKSSTPASRAMVAAVSGLSPVTMTVRMPIRRNSAKRSTRPSLTVSFSSMSPRIRPSSRIAERRGALRRRCGRSPSIEIGRQRVVRRPRAIASTAPFRTSRPSVRRTPLVRVSARERYDLGDRSRRGREAGLVAVPAGAFDSASACAPARRSSGPRASRRWIEAIRAAVDGLAR